MNFIERARQLRKIIELAMTSVDDKVASEAVELFPDMKYDNSLITAGTRINWNGVVKRAAVDLFDTELNNPDNAPTLWEDIVYREGYRIIPEVITPGTAFAIDELGWWNDQLYKSVMDSNVYNPDQYPDGWVLYSESADNNSSDEPVETPDESTNGDESTGETVEPTPDKNPNDNPDESVDGGSSDGDESTGETTESTPDVNGDGSGENVETEPEETVPSGTYENPIPAEIGMEYTEGLHYTYDDIVYRCIRTSVLYYTPDALVGHYFEIA